MTPRQTTRRPVSSSGAAISATDGMAAAGLGTDTAGSLRIPAALCGLAGFKPTVGRVPTDGVFPLSTTPDSVGPLAPGVACRALVDAVFAGEDPVVPEPVPLGGLRFGVPDTPVTEDLEAPAAGAFESALRRLSAAGVHFEDAALRDPHIVVIRNASIANLLGRCALTVPCHEPGDAPVGFMPMGEAMADRRLLGTGISVESVLSPDA